MNMERYMLYWGVLGDKEEQVGDLSFALSRVLSRRLEEETGREFNISGTQVPQGPTCP